MLNKPIYVENVNKKHVIDFEQICTLWTETWGQLSPFPPVDTRTSVVSQQNPELPSTLCNILNCQSNSPPLQSLEKFYGTKTVVTVWQSIGPCTHIWALFLLKNITSLPAGLLIAVAYATQLTVHRCGTVAVWSVKQQLSDAIGTVYWESNVGTERSVSKSWQLSSTGMRINDWKELAMF
jgi:hypothetical protein